MPTTSSPASRSTRRPCRSTWPVPRHAAQRCSSASRTVPSGLYYVQFSCGRRPHRLRAVRGASGACSARPSRVLVVLPTNTWQAYNFQDVDGNGYGDTWYAGPPNRTVDLGRTYIARGVPPRFYRYDLPFLHWLYWSGKQRGVHLRLGLRPDRDRATSSRAAYDLIVFEGHEEYVTAHEYDDVAALPRPRRQPDVPVGQQLLLEGATRRARSCARSASGGRRPARGRAVGAAVPRERRRPAPGPVHRRELGGGTVAVGRHGPGGRVDVRSVRRRLRDRDRLDDAAVAARDTSCWRRSRTCSARGSPRR